MGRFFKKNIHDERFSDGPISLTGMETSKYIILINFGLLHQNTRYMLIPPTHQLANLDWVNDLEFYLPIFPCSRVLLFFIFIFIG